MSSPKENLVLFPSLGMGHLIPMVELAKLLIDHDFSVAIIVVDRPDSSPIDNSFISSVTSAYPSIAFHRLPVSPPRPSLYNFQLFIHIAPQISAFLSSFSQRLSIRALILDMFCTSALDVARELGIPSYFFFASGASVLSAFVSIPSVASQATASFKDLGDTPLDFPGLWPIPASHVLRFVQDRDSEEYKQFVYHCERLPKADGIMINSFEMLERRAVSALTDGSCFPDRPMPPIYCIGPVVAARNGGESERHECLAWLDSQPRGSVVFLSFGSRGAFPKEQLKEIAAGLEKSRQRFLWVVRSPPSNGRETSEPAEPDLEELLPEGFLKRTEGRGMVVKSWAPQAAVLGHGSVGGFVSHCGWNSTLEAVTSGVPMIAWPLYAEQKMNKVFLVEEAKLAVELKGYDKELVSAEEVDRKVRWLMESEGGRELKDRAAGMKQSAVAAREEGGSSEKALKELVRALKEGHTVGTQ